MADKSPQITQAEFAVISAIREVCKRGYGEVTVKVHDGAVRSCVKQEKVSVKVDAA